MLNTSEFFDVDGTLIRTENTDQNKVNSSEASVLTARVAYTEPLSKKSFIELNYSLNHSSNDQKKLSYDKDGNGKYSVLLDSLSSDFKYLYTTNSGGINYRFNEKKYSFSVGRKYRKHRL